MSQASSTGKRRQAAALQNEWLHTKTMNPQPNIFQIFLIFLRLGLTSFGGPAAHLGYFREEFVVRRKWLEEKAYADLVALCQFLPGPSSSQVNLAIGLHLAGFLGALVAWIGFTLPSAIILTLFALGLDQSTDLYGLGWLHGLKLAAVAVVVQAVWSMGRNFCNRPLTLVLGVFSAGLLLAWTHPLSQAVVILIGGAVGALWLRTKDGWEGERSSAHLRVGYGRRFGALLLGIFLCLLLILPWIGVGDATGPLAVFNAFYRAGSLVFGGGHVVLPMLKTATVDQGWIDNNRFLAGYGATQAMPGPLFTFTAYLGAVMQAGFRGWAGAAWALMAIYIPATLLIFGALPFWEKWRHQSVAQAALKGANAAVVGLLLAALIHPIWTSTVHTPREFIIGLIAFLALVWGKWAPWLVVLLTALAGWLLL